MSMSARFEVKSNGRVARKAKQRKDGGVALATSSGYAFGEVEREGGGNAAVPIAGGTFLVTGGAGFIGSHTVDRLLAEGAAQVRVLDDFSRGSWRNLEEAGRTGRLRVYEGDIRKAKTVTHCMEGVDGVFHLTAQGDGPYVRTPRLTVEVMLDGTFNILEAALTQAVKKIVFASSASIYGAAEALPTPEHHHPYNDRTLYGTCKLAGEGMLRSFYAMYGLNYVALRYFHVYGPRMNPSWVDTEMIMRWLNAIDRQEPPVVFGDGQQKMDLIYVEDVAEANVLAMSSDVTDVICNVGSGREISLCELVAILLELTGSAVQPVYQSPRRGNTLAHSLADTRLAEQVLRFRARTDLREGLQRLIAWRHQTTPSLLCLA
jgi:UDP-glucose 4-epimerase